MVVFSLLIQAALHFSLVGMIRGLSWWLSGKESSCQCRTCRRHRIDPWVRTIPWGKKWQSTPVFLPGKSHRQRSLAGCSQKDRRVGHDLAKQQQIKVQLVHISIQVSPVLGTQKTTHPNKCAVR